MFIFEKKLRLIGLGFKAFTSNSYLWIYQGSNNYSIFHIPSDVWVCCKKKKIYILSYNEMQFTSFLKSLRCYKLPGRYKSKGLYEFKKTIPPFNYKPGKKQR